MTSGVKRELSKATVSLPPRLCEVSPTEQLPQATPWMPKPLQGIALDLPDAFPGEAIVSADQFQGTQSSVLDAKPFLKHVPLAVLQHRHLFAYTCSDPGVS